MRWRHMFYSPDDNAAGDPGTPPATPADPGDNAGGKDGDGQGDKSWFNAPSLPEEWSDELKAHVNTVLEETRKDWQRGYTKKREAELEELKRLRSEAEKAQQAMQFYQTAQEHPEEVLRILEATTGKRQAQPGAQQADDDPFADVLTAYDPDEAQTVRTLLDRAAKVAEERAFKRFEDQYGPAIQSFMYERTKQRVHGKLGQDYLDKYGQEVMTQVDRIAADPEALTEAAAVIHAIQRGDEGAIRSLLGQDRLKALLEAEQRAAAEAERQKAAAAATNPAAASPAGSPGAHAGSGIRTTSIEETLADVAKMTPEERAAILASL